MPIAPSSRARFVALALSIVACDLSACDHGTPSTLAPPGSSSAGAVAAASSSSASSSSGSSASASSSAPPSAPPSASAPAAASSAEASRAVDPLEGAPALLGPDGKPLGQTEDKPSPKSPAFERRAELLWKAIVADDPSIAEPAFFPVTAYEQVKDIKKPAADWKSRLLRNFHRDVHEYHKKLGAEPTALRFTGVEIDEPRVKWMDRGKEGNKLGYFRVTRSKIRYADPAGKEQSLELTSLISWRGEWFVVHLHGFK